MPRRRRSFAEPRRCADRAALAGQVGLEPATGSVPGGSFEEEARQALVNLRTVVEPAGAGLERVVKTTVFLGSAEDFATMNGLFAEFFPTAPPVRSTPIVGLPRGFRFAIDAVAYLG